jgi:hypothetical protein
MATNHEYLASYVSYIRNTGLVPLPSWVFDDDLDPVGPQLRARLVEAGLITEAADGLRIVEGVA